jgi:hypothetical protein
LLRRYLSVRFFPKALAKGPLCLAGPDIARIRPNPLRAGRAVRSIKHGGKFKKTFSHEVVFSKHERTARKITRENTCNFISFARSTIASGKPAITNNPLFTVILKNTFWEFSFCAS